MKPFNSVKKCARAGLKILPTKCFEIIHLIYVYKKDLALNNLQWMSCHKTKPSKIKSKKINRSEPFKKVLRHLEICAWDWPMLTC